MKKKMVAVVLAAAVAFSSCVIAPRPQTVQAAGQTITTITPTMVPSVENILPTPTITYPVGEENTYSYVFKFTLKTATQVRITGLSRYTFWSYNGSTKYKLTNSLADATATVKKEWSTHVYADHTWEEKVDNSCDQIFPLNAGTYYLFVNTSLSNDWREQKYMGQKVDEFPLGFWMAVNASTYTASAKLKSCKNKKKCKAVVKYGKVANANGYVVQYSTNKKFKSAKKVTSAKASVTLKSLKKKKTYYVRVRAYRENDGVQYYGAWSNVKKVKIKK